MKSGVTPLNILWGWHNPKKLRSNTLSHQQLKHVITIIIQTILPKTELI